MSMAPSPPVVARRPPPPGHNRFFVIAAVLILAAVGLVVVGGSRSASSRPAVVIPEGNVRDAAGSVEESIFQVGGYGCGGVRVGTGFVVGDGLIATNAHVVAGIPVLQLDPLGAAPRPGILLAFDPVFDLAILQVIGLTEAPLPLSPQGAVAREQVASAGFGGGAISVKSGIVDRIGPANSSDIFDRGRHRVELLRLQLGTVPGDSGSPVLDPGGSVVGVISGGITGSTADTIAVNVTVLKEMVEAPVLQEGSSTCADGRFHVEWADS